MDYHRLGSYLESQIPEFNGLKNLQKFQEGDLSFQPLSSIFDNQIYKGF